MSASPPNEGGQAHDAIPPDPRRLPRPVSHNGVGTVSASHAGRRSAAQEVEGTMREPRWREVAGIARQRGIRARSVASAVLVVLVALLAGGAGLVYLLQHN